MKRVPGWLSLPEAARFAGIPQSRILSLAFDGTITARMNGKDEEVQLESLMWWMWLTRIERAPNALAFSRNDATIEDVEMACREIREQERRTSILHSINRLSTLGPRVYPHIANKESANGQRK